MGDYAYAALSVEGTQAECFKALALMERLAVRRGYNGRGDWEDLDWGQNRSYDPATRRSTPIDDSFYVLWSWGEARYGSSIFEDDQARMPRALRLAGIAHKIVDGGHYSWNPSEQGWVPGMASYAGRANGVEGEVYLTTWDWKRLKDEHIRDESPTTIDDVLALVRAIEAHFGSDPRGWAEATT